MKLMVYDKIIFKATHELQVVRSLFLLVRPQLCTKCRRRQRSYPRISLVPNYGHITMWL